MSTFKKQSMANQVDHRPAWNIVGGTTNGRKVPCQKLINHISLTNKQNLQSMYDVSLEFLIGSSILLPCLTRMSKTHANNPFQENIFL